MLQQLRVKVVINTDDLLKWAARHRELGRNDVAEALTCAANHYASIVADLEHSQDDPPAPTYPRGNAKELRRWANWHIDHSPAGLAHVLFEAAAANTPTNRPRKVARL